MLRDFSSDVFRSALQEDVFELFGRNVADACLSGSAPTEGRCMIFEWLEALFDSLLCTQVQWKHLCLRSDWKW